MTRARISYWLVPSSVVAMNCQNPTGPHLNDAVSESGGILPIMRDIHRCQTECALKPREFGSQVCAEVCVQARERLVQQQYARLTDDRASECHTLLLSS